MILKKPTMLIDKQKCLANIQNLKNKAEQHKLIFRPHFKTHQSAAIGEWFRELGVDKITVSSLTMARYFAAAGWEDITIAFPLNYAEIDDINELAGGIRLNLLVTDAGAVEFLNNHILHSVGVFVKLDAGYHRTGIPVEQHKKIIDLVRKIHHQEKLDYEGLLIHNGHSYHQSGPEAVRQVHIKSLELVNQVKAKLLHEELPGFVSFGDTPTFSLAQDFTGIDEIRPGNFVFFDVMQYFLGSCNFDDIAVAIACPVVAKHPSRNEMIIYGGGIHFSKESILDAGGDQVFGLICRLGKNGWSQPLAMSKVKSLSQEHGVIRTTSDVLSEFNPGDFIAVIPVHSCLATNLMREIFALDGQRFPTINSASTS